MVKMNKKGDIEIDKIIIIIIALLVLVIIIVFSKNKISELITGFIDFTKQIFK